MHWNTVTPLLRARIGKYSDNQQACRNYKAFDLDIKVYRDAIAIPVSVNQ